MKYLLIEHFCRLSERIAQRRQPLLGRIGLLGVTIEAMDASLKRCTQNPDNQCISLSFHPCCDSQAHMTPLIGAFELLAAQLESLLFQGKRYDAKGHLQTFRGS